MRGCNDDDIWPGFKVILSGMIETDSTRTTVPLCRVDLHSSRGCHENLLCILLRSCKILLKLVPLTGRGGLGSADTALLKNSLPALRQYAPCLHP